MSAIDHLVNANRNYVETFPGPRPLRPKLRLTVIACMDSRLDLFGALGLDIGDAHLIRNAGGIVTDDVVRSLLISHDLLETREVMIINHTDCGLMHATEDELMQRVRGRSGTDALAPQRFFAFKDVDENVRHQVQRLRAHPWVPQNLPVRGFVFDVRTGRLREIK